MPKSRKSKKQLFFITILISFIIIAISTILLSTPEDYWMCQNNNWVKHGKPSSPYPTAFCPTANSPSLITKDVVENYYNWYFHTENLIQNNYYKESEYLSQNFINKIKSNISSDSSYDPFICSNRTQKPISFSAQELYTKDNKAVIMLFQHYDVSQDRLEVTLYKKNNLWYINNIECVGVFDRVQGFADKQSLVQID